MANSVTLWIPELLSPQRIEEAGSALKPNALPTLQKFCTRSDCFPVRQKNQFDIANYLLHQPKLQAYASVMAATDLSDYDVNYFWLRAEPVQLVPDRDSLVLMPSDTLMLDESESLALLKAFNAHFAQDQVELLYGGAARWYLKVLQPVDIKTQTIDELRFRPVNDAYPTGNAANYWRKLMNEAQMLFYSHPVNERRRNQGLPEVNSVWFWGEGVLPANQLVMRAQAMIWSDDLYLRGLSKLSGSQCGTSVASFSEWRALVASSDNAKGIEHHVIKVDALASQLDSCTLDQWVERVQSLEHDWLQPLYEQVRKGSIDSLLLDFGGYYRYHFKPSHRYRVFRFKRSLQSL